MVNNYIRNCSGHDFSAKDFRTWAGSLIALESLCLKGKADTATATKQNINSILTEVSHRLGNTKSVCKKYYVHPVLLSLYEEGNLLPKLTATSLSKKTQTVFF